MSKLGITWLWTFFIPIGIGLVLGLYVFAPCNFVSSPGDQRNVMGRYDTSFCDAITLDSSQQFNAYLLGDGPKILQSNRSYNTFQMTNITMKPASFEMWNFYLLEGSMVQFEICNARQMEFFMLKGEDNYKKWENDPFNCECYMDHMSFTSGLPQCVNQTSTDDGTFTYNFTTSIGDTDEYYLVFQNPSNLNPNEMNINLQINRSIYNVQENVKDSCFSMSSCNFSLSFLSLESVVYISAEENLFNIDNRVSCNPTWAVYLTLFGGLPMIIGFSISLGLFVLFMHCPNAWEGVYRPKPWDDEKKPQNTPSILDTLPEAGQKGKKEKEDEKKKSLNGKLFSRKPGYDTLSEEETDEESMETLPRNSPPPAYASTVQPTAEAHREQPSDHPESVTKPPEEMNGVIHVEVHATPE